tara:strand:+ start:50 stop:667 length:618 start_codon:yes stop_codon:yes gene_type:complete
MPFGYLGTTPNQKLNNSGVFSVEEALQVQKDGEWGGSLQLIEEKSISGVSSAIFTDIKEAKYDVHFLEIIDYQPVSDGTDIRIRFYESGVEESASVYQYAFEYMVSTGSRQEVQSTGESYLRATFNTGNATNEKGNSYNYFYNLGNSSKYSFQTMQTVLIQDNGNFNTAFGGGVLPQASAVDQIKLYNSGGNFSCTAKLYGVKQL